MNYKVHKNKIQLKFHFQNNVHLLKFDLKIDNKK